VKIARTYFGNSHPILVEFEQELGQSLVVLGAYEQAKPICDRALSTQSQRYGADHLATVAARNCLAVLCGVDGERARAQELSRESMAIILESTGEHAPLGVVIAQMYELYIDPTDQEEVIRFMERAVELVHAAFGPNHPATAMRWAQLAGLYVEKGDLDRAGDLLERALGVATTVTGSESLLTAQLLSGRAGRDLRAGELERANADSRRAEAIFRFRLGDQNLAVGQALELRGKVRAAQGDYRQATRLSEQSAAVLRAARPTESLCLSEDTSI